MAAVTESMLNCVQCSLTLEAFVDPVIVSTGHAYERTALEAWIRQSGRRCPCTGLAFSKEMFPCYALKGLAADLVATREHPWAIEPWRVQLGSLLSRTGNQGEVYKGLVKDKEGFERTVAVKVFKDGPKGAMAAFEKEVQLLHLASRRCEGVVQLLGGCKKGDDYCLIMKLYSKNILRLAEEEYGGRLPLPALCRYMATVARALQSLHEHNIISQDIKPENILYDEITDSVVIADFGISKIAVGTMGVKNSADGVGTPNYMAPEQWDTECTVTAKADIWGLGGTMLTLASGVEPWAGLRLVQILNKVVGKKSVPPLPESVPQGLRALLRRCLTHDPAARPDAAEVLRDLLAVSTGHPGLPPPVTSSVLKAQVEALQQLLSSMEAERDNEITLKKKALEEVESWKQAHDDEISLKQEVANEMKRVKKDRDSECKLKQKALKEVEKLKNERDHERLLKQEAVKEVKKLTKEAKQLRKERDMETAFKTTALKEIESLKNELDTLRSSLLPVESVQCGDEAASSDSSAQNESVKKGKKKKKKGKKNDMKNKTKDKKGKSTEGKSEGAKDVTITKEQTRKMKSKKDMKGTREKTQRRSLETRVPELDILSCDESEVEYDDGDAGSDFDLYTRFSPTDFSSAEAERVAEPGIFTAVTSKDKKALRIAVARGADVNATNSDGLTALHVAAEVGNAVATRVLLRSKAVVDARKPNGMTPMHVAVGSQSASAVEVVACLLDASADVNTKTSNHLSPLHRAASAGSTEMVRCLLEAGADVHAVNGTNGRTALHYAAERRADLVLTLLAVRADVNAQTKQGSTALHYGVLSGRRAIVKALLDHGADPMVRRLDGKRPFDLAEKKAKILTLLLDHNEAVQLV